MAKKLHLGFKETQAKIAKKQGIPMKAAGAILADSARKASPAAVKKNPSLLNVKRSKGKKYQDGGKTGAQLKAEGIAIKKKGLKIKAEGQKMKLGKNELQPGYKQTYKVTSPQVGFEEDKMHEKTQVLNKGSKTIVNKRSFSKMAEGYMVPGEKSTTIYDKKTGITKRQSVYKKGGKITTKNKK